jgi:RimJ/RimL family protein N-acetyltransferase
VLRLFRVGDAAEVAAACDDPDIVRFTFMQEGLTEADAQEWIRAGNERWPHGHPRFAIADVADDRVLGQLGMAVNEQQRSAEAYYWVSPRARRWRIASSALCLLADWAFAEGVERLFL